MLRFTLFGFPVQIHWLFWVTCAILGGGFYARGPEDWLRIAIWTAVVLVSIVVHELGHALAGRRYGGRPSILLHGLGGLTILPGLRLDRGRSILLSLAGPLAGLALGGLTLLAAPLLVTSEPLARYTLASLLYVNIFWSFFNLLPILPLDGGQIMRSLLGPTRRRQSAIVGTAVAGLLAALALAIGQWILAIFFAVLAYGNYRESGQIQGGVYKPG